MLSQRMSDTLSISIIKSPAISRIYQEILDQKETGLNIYKENSQYSKWINQQYRSYLGEKKAIKTNEKL